MKKITLLLFLFIFGIGLGQRNDTSNNNRFELLKNYTQTKILYDNVAPIAELKKTNNTAFSTLYYKQAFHEIQRSDFLNRLPKIETLDKETEKGFANSIIPISVLVSKFEAIKQSVIDQNQLQLNSNNQYEPISNEIDLFDTYEIGLVSPLIKQLKGTEIKFKLDSNLIFNTTSNGIAKIEANFDNTGFKTIIADKINTVNFSSLGTKSIEFKITLNDGSTFTNKTKVTLKEKAIPLDYSRNISQNAPAAVSPLTTITSSLTYQGTGETSASAGVGEFQIFYDNEAGLLDKIILVCDGFDPADGRDTNAIYNLLNYGNPTQNLGDVVRDQGYDVVVLNFPQYTRPDGITNIDGGVDYIQRNARVMMEMINYLNANKVGNQELVIIGPSMGGLISRYALRYMEMNGMDHKTRLWLSFDSPHLGANVPIGMQHMFNYIAYDGDISDLTVRAIVDSMLKSPAARQMLIDHFEGHLASGSLTNFNTNIVLPTGHPTYRNIFQNELNTMGFPQNLRKIAIANGAGNGTMTGSPGMAVLSGLDVPDSSGLTRALLDLNFTPNTNNQARVSRVRKQAWTFFWLTIGTGQADSRSPSYTAGLDSAPGGQFDIEGLAADAGSNPTLARFLNAMTIKKFDFIPVQSSLAITNTTNWYANVTASSNSAFDAYSVPTTNELHVTLTNSNVVFALNEIVNNIQLKCPAVTTWDGSNWSNGLPAKDKQVVFNGNYTSSFDIEACSVAVNGNAIVTFLPSHDLTVRGAINVSPTAQLKMNNNANLYQIEEISNSGNTEVTRNTSLKRLDYAAWSAPVANQNLKTFSPNTLNNRFYEYIPTGTTTPTAYNSVDPLTTNFTSGKGFMIRASNNLSSTTTSWNGIFNGVPNNGRTNHAIIYGGAAGLGYNLVGNPYPSPINIQEFIVGNTNTIDGTLHFWTNTNDPVGGVYTINNFASRNLSGGTAAVNGTLVPDEYIQTGQGFFINALASGPLYFTNSMRNPISNNQFMSRTVAESNEKNRFWLNLTEGNNHHNQILIGYIENATNDFDFGYDGKLLNNGSSAIYSLLNDNDELVIQGKSLPFNDTDIVPLGFKSNNDGLFTISIDHADGLFANGQVIYLKDKLTNVIYDLTANDYTFVANSGTTNDRFEIVFKNSLSENNPINVDNTILAFSNDSGLNITSSVEKIKSITVYDLVGRTLYTNDNIDKTNVNITSIAKTESMILVNIKTENNQLVKKKVMF